MSSSLIKICGLTRAQDLDTCIKFGVNAVGFVFYPPSPRAVSAEQAKRLISAVPAFMQTVGLFVDASLQEIAATLRDAPIDILQFHGHETAHMCQEIGTTLGKRWIKALAVKTNTTSEIEALSSQIAAFKQAGASAILLDAWHPQLMGGTGQTFDWSVVENIRSKYDIPLILAGGLTPQNVGKAIQTTRPYAVDVSGGVEATDSTTNKPLKGIKDSAKIAQFVTEVLHA